MTLLRRARIYLLMRLLPILLFMTVVSLGLAARPNIVLIISDDQTFRDFEFMGNKSVHTPHLDKLASQSAFFPNGYVPSSVCSPSLTTILTGLYPHQHGIHRQEIARSTK